jgi:competence protein ComEC
MNRPLVFITVFYILGIAAAELLKVSLPVAAIIFILAAAASAALWKKTDKTVFAAFFALGIFMYSFQTGYFPKNHIKNYPDIMSIKAVEVLVDAMPEETEERIYFTGRILKLFNKASEITGITGRVRVTIEKTLGERIQYGDILKIKGVLREPAEPKNEGEFNYKKYLRYKGVYFTVYAKGQAIEITGVKIPNYFFYWSLKAKDGLLRTIYSSLPGAEARILDGLLLGNQRAIPDETYDKFKITGTVHILAVSGMNVGLISLFIFLFLKILRVKRKAAAAITLVFITAFAVITGAGASIVRATIMAYVVLIGMMLERDIEIYNSLAIAALLILFFNPADLYDAGFQLSFLATLGLVYYSELLNNFFPGVPDAVKETVCSTIAAQVFLTPVMAGTFHQVSVISLLANFFVVPLAGIISILGFVMWMLGAVSMGAARIFGGSIWALIKAMKFVVDVMAAVPYAAVSVKTVPAIITGMYYIFFLILPYRDIDIKIWKIPGKAALGAALLILIPVHLLVPEPGAKFYALAAKDVNAVFYRTFDNKKVLILGCDDYKKNAGVRNVVVPFLRFNGVNNIDELLLYSVKNEANIRNIKMNFNVRDVIKDEEYRNGAFYRRIGGGTELNLDSYMAELDYKDSTFIFTKLLAGKALEKIGCVIYSCFYSGANLAGAARNNTCIINSGTIRGFNRRKTAAITGVWDVNTMGMKKIPY